MKLSSANAPASRRAFTLVEVMMSTAISSLLLVVIGAVSVFSGRSTTALANYSDLEMQSRTALDQMTSEIRQAQQVTSYATNDITLNDWDSQPLRYVYDPIAQTLTRIKCSNTNLLLEGCNYLCFSMYQRNTTNGTYSQYPATDPTVCKLIQIDWVCVRTILGAAVNTESVQSAKVVIRKK